MVSKPICRIQNPLVSQLSDFLTANIDLPETAWPRQSLPRPTGQSVRRPEFHELQLRVLVVGDLVLELPVETEAPPFSRNSP